jgi:calcineurin-like phosphoesterase family protein
MIYFTADQHFNHQNIIKFVNRPWQWVWQMDEALIEIFNSIVTDNDEVYHLGDFAWKASPEDYLCRLRGKSHHLICGNHDKRDKCAKFFSTVQDVKLLKIQGIPQIWLSHYAHRSWPSSHHGSIHLFAHSHGTLRIDPEIKCCDVGVDAWNYKPVSLNEILVYFS